LVTVSYDSHTLRTSLNPSYVLSLLT